MTLPRSRLGPTVGPFPLATCLLLGAILALAGAVAHPRLRAQAAEPRLELVSQTGGTPQSVAISGRHAYVGVGPRLLTVDLADPRVPMIVNQGSNLGGMVTAMAAEPGRLAACVEGEDEVWWLLILSLAVPARPEVVGQLLMDAACYDVALGGGLAYVAYGAKGQLDVVDLSDASHPVRSATLNLFEPADVAAEGRLVYVAAGGLVVVDAADPRNPLILSHFDEAGTVRAVDVAGPRALLGTEDNGLHLVDVSNPSAPAPLNHTESIGSVHGVALGDGHALVEQGQDYLLFSLSQDGPPVQIAQVEEEEFSDEIHHVDSDGALGVGVSRRSGLHVFGLGGSWPPGPLGQLDLPDPSRQVAALPGGAIATDAVSASGRSTGSWTQVFGMAVQVFAAPDPARPSFVGDLHTSSDVKDLRSDGRVALISALEGTVSLVTSADGEPPRVVNHLAFDGPVGDLALDSGYAYVPVYANDPMTKTATMWLHVLDVSRPPALVDRGAVRVQETTRKSRVSGRLGRLSELPTARVAAASGFVYILEGEQLNVVDVRQPTEPRLVASLAGFVRSHFTMDIATDAERLVVLTISDLEVYDRRDPARPVLVGKLETGGLRGHSVLLTEGLAVIADPYSGLRLVDCRDLANPRLIQTLPVYFPVDVSLSGDLLVVAAADGGLLWVRLDRGPTPTPTTAGPPVTASPPSPTDVPPLGRCFLPWAGALRAGGMSP